MSDIDLLNQIIDLKVSAAVAAMMAKVNEVAAAHNKLASEIVPPLVADLERRKAAENKTKDEQIAALQKTLADMKKTGASIVIPPAEAQG